MDADNMMVCALWLGPCKPPMELLLQPVLSRINEIEDKGLELITPQGSKVLKVKLIAGVFDLPAKAMALNVVQFNGYYGCPYCIDRGFHKYNRHLYYPDEPHQLRKQRNIDQWAEQAELTGRPVYGIKGFSHLKEHLTIDCIPLEYMHFILEGITKAFLDCWLNPKNKQFSFYIGDHEGDIDKYLLRIKPPHEFWHSPRPISKRFYWKASEYRAWLLYYSLPVLIKILPSDYMYVHHFALFITSVHMLLGNNITAADISIAEEMLLEFYNCVPDLYPETMLSANLHSIIHVCRYVRKLGPLWAYSTFGFENMNGHIINYRHGTRNFLPGILRSIALKYYTPAYIQELSLSENSRTMEFLDKKQMEHTGPLGRLVQRSLLDIEIDAIHNAGFHVPDGTHVTVFPCFCINKTSYRARKVGTLRDSSVCELNDGPRKMFRSIRKFCFVTEGPIAIVDVFVQQPQSILETLTVSKSIFARNELLVSKYFIKVLKLSVSKKDVAVSAYNLIQKCACSNQIFTNLCYCPHS